MCTNSSFYILVSLCLFVTATFAQPFTDIASLNYQYHVPSEYLESQLARNRDLTIASADLLLPLSLGRGSYLLAGGQHAQFDFGFELGTRQSESFLVTEIRIGTLYQWRNQKDKTLILMLPKWSGEKNFLDRRYFQLGGVVLHTHTISPVFSIKLGLYYNREFFGNFFMPLGGFDWQINEDLWLYGTLPGNLQLHNSLTPAFAISASYVSPSGSLLFMDGNNHIRIGKSFPPYSIFSVDAHWMVLPPLTLKVSIGHSLWRSYGAYNADEVHYEQGLYADYKDGLVLRASLIARVMQN